MIGYSLDTHDAQVSIPANSVINLVFGWLGGLIRGMSSIMAKVMQCPCSRAPIAEGKTYCPDCGAGVIHRWVILTCHECGRKRPATYYGGAVMPTHRCCHHCGTQAVERQYLEEVAYYQLPWALLERQPTHGHAPVANGSPRVWVSPDSSPGCSEPVQRAFPPIIHGQLPA